MSTQPLAGKKLTLTMFYIIKMETICEKRDCDMLQKPNISISTEEFDAETINDHYINNIPFSGADANKTYSTSL